MKNIPKIIMPIQIIMFFFLEGTFSVKFKIYVRQMTILGGVLNNCQPIFYHLIII